MTAAWLQSRSFILMKNDARLTASNSTSAACQSLSYSSLRQRVTLRPAHLLAFWATSEDRNWFMKYWGSGETMVVLNIWRSAEKCGYVSALLGSEEKNTEATTDFSSTSRPALAQACLTMAWFFWRSELVDVV